MIMTEETQVGITVKEYLLTLLQQLELNVPPSKNGHHAITASRYGSEEEGWSDELTLQINNDGVFQAVFLDEEDFTNSPLHLANEISGVITQMDTDTQVGVSGVQYN
jgi:hypothetical protein